MRSAKPASSFANISFILEKDASLSKGRSCSKNVSSKKSLSTCACIAFDCCSRIRFVGSLS
jgi:hypothetical protein